MSARTRFPLPLRSIRTLSGGEDRSYVVGAMFTSAYSSKAERLAASCEKFGLRYVITEVPTVHRSISPGGSDDLAYTKPNFIRSLISAHRKPVLYVDADCEFVSPPDLIDDLVRSRCDFAIYNWCADECTDMFEPVAFDGQSSNGRFYRFAGSLDYFARDQLVCSGLVQYHAHSFAARSLLRRWHEAIARYRGCADDGALGFVFNNLTRRSLTGWLLKTRWLPKSYARIAWWIYVKPVINHPDLPRRSESNIPINDPKKKIIYASKLKRPTPSRIFPPGFIIDTERRMLCRLVDGELVAVEPIGIDLWL